MSTWLKFAVELPRTAQDSQSALSAWPPSCPIIPTRSRRSWNPKGSRT